MTRLTTVWLLLAMCSPVRAGEPNRLTDTERKQGWRLLFDGKTTDGWQEITGKPFPSQCWTVEDGSLKALVRSDGFQDIRTAETFRNFELQFDWKILKAGNSGVKYRIQRVDEWNNAAGRQARARGLEYQLADSEGGEGASDARHAAGALYSLIAPKPAVRALAGEFNSSRLIVRGHHVEHWLNGVKVVEFDTSNTEVQKILRDNLPKGSDARTAIAETSPISLQNHGSEAWFRNIKIRVPGQ